jgi:hypothetical protein
MREKHRSPEATMMDLLFVGLSLLFFGLSWALVRLFERL